MTTLIALLILGLLIYFVLRGAARSRWGSGEAEDELLHRCLGDRQQAERLMALEAENAPDISRAEAARRALRSLHRDLK